MIFFNVTYLYYPSPAPSVPYFHFKKVENLVYTLASLHSRFKSPGSEGFSILIYLLHPAHVDSLQILCLIPTVKDMHIWNG